MRNVSRRYDVAILAALYFHVLITFSESTPRNARFNHGSAFASIITQDRRRKKVISSRRPSFDYLSKECQKPNSMHPRVLGNTRLHFSVNFNGDHGDFDDNGNDNEDDDDDELELDFSTWARALRRWPLYPTSKTSAPKEESEKGGSKPSIPLANLINVEALLMASGEETIDNVADIELFEFGELGMDKKGANDKTETEKPKSPAPLSYLPFLEELGNWDKFLGTLQRSISDLTKSNPSMTKTDIVKESTARIEDFVSEASQSISPAKVQDLVVRASKLLALEENANGIVKTAEKIARQQGLDVSEAAERARETTKYTTNLVKLANGLLVSGYVAGDRKSKNLVSEDLSADVSTKPLFDGYKSVAAIPLSEYTSTVAKGAEMGELAGAIYQDTIPRSHAIGHSIVANGTSADVAWMVTDSIGYEDEFGESSGTDKSSRKPVFIRTITIRGFDASDESVDREALLNEICTANPVTFGGVQIHSGLLSKAKAIYGDVKKYIDMTAPTHRLVLNGHSVGGSLATLLLFLLTDARGADYVKEKVLRVFTFGSPPVVKKPENFLANITMTLFSDNLYHCDILKSFGLPESMVYGYVQPWDPIIRLFTKVDALYPLLGDLGKDGKTLYASGPNRSLRPITRAIVESWEGWPRFRDNFRSTVNQNYTSVGTQHLLLPERIRYLSDRFVSVSVSVPPVEKVVKISSKELLPALKHTFPLDVFQISFVPTAIRSFVHHFYPAYGFPIVDYAKKKKGGSVVQSTVDIEDGVNGKPPNGLPVKSSQEKKIKSNAQGEKAKDWPGRAAQWILGDGV